VALRSINPGAAVYPLRGVLRANQSATGVTAWVSHSSWSRWLLVTLVLGLLVIVGNPALAMLAGGAMTLALNQPLVEGSSRLSQYCLQSAIVLLGLRLSLDTLWSLSATYTWSVATYVVLTLGAGVALGRLFKVDGPSSQLIAAGTAICGGTAIATLSPVLKAQPRQTAVALAIVFLLNAVALFTFPLIGEFLNLSQLQFGIWSALAIHDTSAVVATATSYGEEAARVATTLKLGRTLWIIPVVLGASLMQGSGGARLRVPGFIVLFLLAVVLGSILPIPEAFTAAVGGLSKGLLVCALFFVGLQLTRATIASIRGRVLCQALVLWGCLAPLTLVAVLGLSEG
jgi:uncharacterized integral membrane protein (TIGR00698 family)